MVRLLYRSAVPACPCVGGKEVESARRLLGPAGYRHAGLSSEAAGGAVDKRGDQLRAAPLSGRGEGDDRRTCVGLLRQLHQAGVSVVSYCALSPTPWGSGTIGW